MKHTLKVLFEDQWLIIASKPSGMLSVGYPGYKGKSAQDVLTEMHRGKGKLRIAIVHRLDRDTSGVMMYACTAEAKERIMNDWQSIVTERTYRCVCTRRPGSAPLADSGTINAPIAYNKMDVGFVPRKDDAIHLKDAEKAVTRFKVIQRGATCDLVECELETGKKNQIRVHLAHLGHPVLGDEVYGDTEDGKAASGSSIGRLALHARVLAFKHPFTGEMQRFEESEPVSFKKVVEEKPSAAKPAAQKPADKADAKGAGVKSAAGAGAKFGERSSRSRQKDDYAKQEELPPMDAVRSSRNGRFQNGSRFIPSK